MPELPEVQTIACGLEKELSGRRFQSVDIRRPKSVEGDAELFARAIPGSAFVRARRRGKALLLDLDSPACGPVVMGVHLRMTGRLYLPEPGEQPDKHTHIVFRLAPQPGKPDFLYFRDSRTFGSCRVFQRDDEACWPFLTCLGPEPLDIGPQHFAGLFAGRRGRIKALLLDQHVIAGIGNIYADESLFRAGIRPDARADELKPEQLAKLHGELQAVLREAIAACGSSISDYRDARGNAGAFQNQFRVYGRTGEKCVACGRTLQSMKVAGRTSVYCPRCQG